MELMKRMEKALLSYGYTILYRNDEYGIIQAGIAESGGAFGMVSQGAGFYTSKPSHLKEFVSITVDNNYLFIRADSNAVSPDSWWRSRISDELPK